MKAIMCVSESWGIGKDNKLLYHIHDDMAFFKKQTTNKIVIMGRKTYESIGKPLPNRINVVITKDVNFTIPINNKLTDINNKYCLNNMVIHSFETVRKFISEKVDNNDVFIIGGASIYNNFLLECDEIYVTKVHDDKPCDFKINYNLDNMDYIYTKEILNTEFKTITDDGIKYDFILYKRK